MRRYLALHAQNLLGALERAARQPIATTLTILVIAVALALPAGLRVTVINIVDLSNAWGGAADFTAYLRDDLDAAAAAALAAELEAREDIANVTLITRDDALEEFRSASGFGEAIDALGTNPLPHTLILRPRRTALADVESLADELADHAAIDLVQIDAEWLGRLRAIIALIERFVLVAGGVLGLAVVVLIGNTIRLEINGRRTEIEVMKLVGGSDGFIRRPFLYLGLWYGFIGAAAALILLGAGLWLLQSPVAQLAGLYGSQFALTGLPWREMLVVLVTGAALGWAGAGLATARHLRLIEPS